MKRIIIWVCAFLIGLSACHPVPSPDPTGGSGPTFKTPQTLRGIDTAMTPLAVAGAIAIALGMASFFALPATHKLSGAAVAVGVSLLATSLLVKVSLPFVPWVAGALALIGASWSAYRLLVHKSVVPEGIGKTL